MPLYEEMLSKFEDRSKLTAFCVRWEKDFPQEKGKGILFVGRVVNGGNDKADTDIDTLFSDTAPNRILQPNSPIGWVEYFMTHKRNDYKINHSAFWKVIKGISQNIYGEDNHWYSHIAWTNLYKVSPCDKGNPTSKQEKLQLPYCKKILKAEIEVLQPQFVVFLTSRREEYNGFIMENYGTLEKLEVAPWGKKYETKLYKVSNGMYFIKSYHPQGKPVKAHIEVISKMIKERMTD